MAISLRERNKQTAMAAVRAMAFSLMETHGFAKVTVEQIATASNVSPSTVYRYFGTKEALVLSAERPQQLVDRLASDTSKRTNAEAFRRAAIKVWESPDSSRLELDLIFSNPELARAWERQLLDQRGGVAAAFASRREAKGPGLKDRSNAAACLGILTTVLLIRQEQGLGAKPLDKLLTKAFEALSE